MTDFDEVLAQAQEDVDKGLTKGSFNLTSALRKRGFPESDVVVYLDEDAAHELVQLNEVLEVLAQSPEQNTEEYDSTDEIAQRLAKQIRDSALRFHLRGISPGHIEQARKNVRKEFGGDIDDPETQQLADQALAHDWIAAHIVRVTNAQGETDERLFKREDVAELEELLPFSEFSKIDQEVNNLSFRTAYVEQATDAGFLPRS